jgi:hypothetical protein
LSLDQAKCREFDVNGDGVISGAVAAGGCEHATGIGRGGAGARSIQLCGGGLADPDAPTMCFSDTPVPGGEYKVWVTSEADYLTGCAQLGKPSGLSVIDCGAKTKSYFHGFTPERSRSHNFKVGGQPRNIVTRFYGLAGGLVDGMQVTWSDPLGGSNNTYAYEDLSIDLHHEARIDDIEIGTHLITVRDQPGCAIGTIYVDGKRQPKTGSQTIGVMVRSNWSGSFGTVFVDVYCQ